MMEQSEWFERLKTWVPSWMLAQSTHVEPILQAMAKVMAALEAERKDLIEQTFIGMADGDWLDTHGAERATKRASPELDSTYADRVRTKHLVSKADGASLKALVDRVLIRGTSSFAEDGEDTLFLRPGLYFNRGIVIQPSNIKDAFTITIDKQIHPPYSFMSRGVYANRGAFTGSIGTDESVYRLLIQIVNENRAFGAPFRVIERHN